jgi:hypothetical protein
MHHHSNHRCALILPNDLFVLQITASAGSRFSLPTRVSYGLLEEKVELMRANGSDIVELFGFSPDDVSRDAVKNLQTATCPFLGSRCTKSNHDQTVIYGTCAVTGAQTRGVRSEVIICPKRLYAQNYQIFENVTQIVWGNLPVIVGGDLQSLYERASQHPQCVVAFGQNSGQEVSVNSNGKLSMDWVLQRYSFNELTLVAEDFVGIEIQSIDITGNYRDTFTAYSAIRKGERLNSVPNSGHGLNWANVHKRLIPQIIRKGNVYSRCERCVGFFFILPEQVYRKFDEVLGEIEEERVPGKDNLTVLTYVLGDPVGAGQIRQLVHTMSKHHTLNNIAVAFSTNTDPEAPHALDSSLRGML